jgi:hypothetical protein
MIYSLVQSAFQTGYLSVESEGLIRQVVGCGGCNTVDLEALQQLCRALETGDVRRETRYQMQMPIVQMAS